MSSITSQIIPFSLFFVLVILFLALKKNPKQESKSNKTIEIKDNIETRKFLEDSELKLIALRDLYKQDLINANIYIKKTEDIAKIITEKIGKDLDHFTLEKKNEIYDQLKVDIVKKVKTNKNVKDKTNLDVLISAVDKRIESGFDYEKS